MGELRCAQTEIAQSENISTDDTLHAAPAGKAWPVGVRALLGTRPSAAAATKVVLFARFKERHMKSRMRRRGYKSCTTPLRDPRP